MIWQFYASSQLWAKKMKLSREVLIKKLLFVKYYQWEILILLEADIALEEL